jgi:hypothetical protein
MGLTTRTHRPMDINGVFRLSSFPSFRCLTIESVPSFCFLGVLCVLGGKYAFPLFNLKSVSVVSVSESSLPQPEHLDLQPITRLPDSDDMTGRRRIILKLPSQLGDMDVDRASHHFRLVTPDFLEKLEA